MIDIGEFILAIKDMSGQEIPPLHKVIDRLMMVRDDAVRGLNIPHTVTIMQALAYLNQLNTIMTILKEKGIEVPKEIL